MPHSRADPPLAGGHVWATHPLTMLVSATRGPRHQAADGGLLAGDPWTDNYASPASQPGWLTPLSEYHTPTGSCPPARTGLAHHWDRPPTTQAGLHSENSLSSCLSGNQARCHHALLLCGRASPRCSEAGPCGKG